MVNMTVIVVNLLINVIIGCIIRYSTLVVYNRS